MWSRPSTATSTMSSLASYTMPMSGHPVRLYLIAQIERSDLDFCLGRLEAFRYPIEKRRPLRLLQLASHLTSPYPYPSCSAQVQRAQLTRRIAASRRERTGNRSLVLFDSGDEVTVEAGEEGIRFLLVSEKPLREPVAWYGPTVMNTQVELQQVARELRDGTFIKSG